jgi:serine/threonine protein kinase
MILALSYLHSLGIVHRDLKLENIMLEGKEACPLSVKLIDFGLARFIGPEDCGGHKRKRQSSSVMLLQTRCGSEEYAAPEILQGRVYDGTRSDAWSFGICLYACLLGALPFNPDPKVTITASSPVMLAEKIIGGSFSLDEETVSKEAASLIKGLLQTDPNLRLTIDEARRHPWFDSCEM